MPVLLLSSDTARQNGHMIQVVIPLDGREGFPGERYEIKTAAEAKSLFEAYAAKAEASKLPLYVSGRLSTHPSSRDRAPRGFKQLTLRKYVNLV